MNANEETLRQLTNEIKLTKNNDERKRLEDERKTLLRIMKIE